MQPERWQQIDQLFHLVLDQECGQRAAFLAEVCAGDDALRSEVEALISSHEAAENFIETPAFDLAAELLAKGQAGLRSGETVGPYRIESVLGIGGMGEVYLAQDTRLGRQVALKLLPPQFTIDPERVRRFEQEARAASALNHPNIVTIHEIGRINSSQFIVTEFVDGQTLRRRMSEMRLSLPESIDAAIQIASALEAAHAAGIVHRDIKPENVMIRRDHILKVLDFGLAKLTEQKNLSSDPEGAMRTLVKTSPGIVMGTVQYMSPEQARAKAVDARTDIWSLGVVLYEMVTGRVPFEGETPSHVIVSVLESELPPLARHSDVPAELERIVAKALRKKKDERYQTVSDLAFDLKNLKQELEIDARLKRSLEPEKFGCPPSRLAVFTSLKQPPEGSTPNTQLISARRTSSAEYLVSEIKRHKGGVALAAAAVVVIAVMAVSYFYFIRNSSASATGEAIDSVAVLPFVNVNNDLNTEYLSDGISDSIINSLSRLPALKVMSLNSVLRYKGKQTDPQVIGKAMNVRAVLLGRLTQQGDNLIISTELVDTRDNRRLWGEQYNRKLSDILVVQNEIAREIADRLRLQLSSQDKKQLSKSYTDNTEAYRLYSLGMYHARKESREDLNRSIEYFEQAIKIDPNYPLAYTGLVRTYGVLGQRGFWFPKEAQQKAEWAALKAVEIDDTLAEAHAVLGFVKKSNWDWAGAEKELKRALELDPKSESANFVYSVTLMQLGRTDEALVYAKRAEDIGGEFPRYQLQAFAYFYAHEYDKAIELYLKVNRNRPRNVQLAVCYLEKGMYQEAIDELQEGVASDNAPEKWGGYPLLAYAYAIAGRRDEAMKILNEQKELAKQRYISPFNFAVIYTGLGDKDRAFEYLKKAYEEGSQVMPHFPRQPIFDSLHSDPRYSELLRRMNLTP